MIRVLIVDDHALIRLALRRILEESGEINVVSEVSSGEEAVEFARRNPLDLVLMDVDMPGMGGVEATRKLNTISGGPRVIVISVHSQDPYPKRLLEAGASGYLSKSSSSHEVISAVRTVYAGQPYVAPEVAGQLAMASINRTESPLDSLTQREMQVMLMLTRGQNAQTISRTLNLSPKTVCTYRYRLYEKLDVRNDVELTHLAIRHGLIEGGRP
jgi:two-component system invasion response regulator UvrY